MLLILDHLSGDRFYYGSFIKEKNTNERLYHLPSMSCLLYVYYSNAYNVVMPIYLYICVSVVTFSKKVSISIVLVSLDSDINIVSLRLTAVSVSYQYRISIIL